MEPFGWGGGFEHYGGDEGFRRGNREEVESKEERGDLTFKGQLHSNLKGVQLWRLE